MRMKPIFLAISSLCISSFMANAHAEQFYYSNSSPNNGGYQSSGSAPSYPANGAPGYQHRGKHVSVSVNFPPQNNPVSYPNRPHYPRFKGPQWADMWQGNPLPTNVVVGGHQPNPPLTFYVCRGSYQGGMHPGKLMGNRCNISWGGNEIQLSRYQVLVSRAPLGWASANNGYIPPNAIDAGFENGRPLYACQAYYRGGMHPGKVVGNRCLIGWGGREIGISYYNVLVR